MKLYNIATFTLVGIIAASCSDIDNMLHEGNNYTEEQKGETEAAMPERLDASFSGMFEMMGKPCVTYGLDAGRDDDFGFISAAISLDFEGADMVSMNNTLNWFSPASDLSTRDANYANPYMRYNIPYRQLGLANQMIDAVPENSKNPTAINMRAQACAIRAFDYMQLAPYFQFADASHMDDPCIPLLDGEHDMANNPRASVRKVWGAVITDLNWAIAHLTEARADKSKINKNVALGLRARANLFLGNFKEAAEDAAEAMKGFTPAGMEDISVPAFCSISEANWMWGINITTDLANTWPHATSSAWITGFSADGYAAYAQCTPQINVLLYKEIPATDVRKNWWIDENLYSPVLDKISWNGVTGADISTLTIENVKKAFLPYTNVKFGMKSGVGSTINNNDWPLMRVEEMILIQAEGLAKSGNPREAETVLTNFLKTYRDPSYKRNPKRTLEDEIWFQRRVELWGEGFFTGDAKRMSKPVVRFHADVESNFPDAFMFNIAADDGWMNMRFPQSEMNSNKGIVDNEGGAQPVAGQNPELRDGVTD